MIKDKVFHLVSKIPPGKVVTYGQISNYFGLNCPRVIGNILHNNPDPEKIPCHRVVNYQGKLASAFAFGGAEAQAVKLFNEGIELESERVNLKKYRWNIGVKNDI